MTLLLTFFVLFSSLTIMLALPLMFFLYFIFSLIMGLLKI